MRSGSVSPTSPSRAARSRCRSPVSPRRTIEQRAETRYCLVGPDGENYGCAASQQAAEDALAELTVVPQVAEACLVDPDGEQLECFATEELAEASKAAITVAPRVARDAIAHARLVSRPCVGRGTGSAWSSAAGEQLDCFPTRKEAQAAQEALEVEVTEQTYCVTERSGYVRGAEAHTVGDALGLRLAFAVTRRPSRRRSRASRWARTISRAAWRRRTPPASAIDGTQVQTVDALSCVVSSAGENLGCFIDRASAEERRRSTGQQRLLDVIGQTARLEERPVLAIVPPGDPAYATTPVTCPTDEDRQTKECSFSALEDQEVVYEDESREPVPAGARDHRRRRRRRGERDPGRCDGLGVDRQLPAHGRCRGSVRRCHDRRPCRCRRRRTRSRSSSTGSSSPRRRVQSPITGGTGEITGGFTEAEARTSRPC